MYPPLPAVPEEQPEIADWHAKVTTAPASLPFLPSYLPSPHAQSIQIRIGGGRSHVRADEENMITVSFVDGNNHSE